jgi:hypothetical protein
MSFGVALELMEDLIVIDEVAVTDAVLVTLPDLNGEELSAAAEGAGLLAAPTTCSWLCVGPSQVLHAGCNRYPGMHSNS